MNGLLIQWGSILSGSGIVQLPTSYTQSYKVVQGFGYYNNNLTKVWSYDNSHIITEGGPSESVDLSWFTIGYQSNGLIRQWGNTNGNIDTAIQIPVSFSNMNNYFVTASSVDSGRAYDMVIKVDANHIKVFDTFYGSDWGITGGKMVWFAIGY